MRVRNFLKENLNFFILDLPTEKTPYPFAQLSKLTNKNSRNSKFEFQSNNFKSAQKNVAENNESILRNLRIEKFHWRKLKIKIKAGVKHMFSVNSLNKKILFEFREFLLQKVEDSEKSKIKSSINLLKIKNILPITSYGINKFHNKIEILKKNQNPQDNNMSKYEIKSKKDNCSTFSDSDNPFIKKSIAKILFVFKIYTTSQK